jgi:hypothetical protein
VVSTTTNSATVTIGCPASKIAVGGGGQGGGTAMLTGSYPNATTGAATSWTATFDRANSNNRAYVICANN